MKSDVEQIAIKGHNRRPCLEECPNADLPTHRPARPAGGKPANRVSETNMFTERAFRAVARLDPRPDVVVITGDLTECGLDAEYAHLNRLLRKAPADAGVCYSRQP